MEEYCLFSISILVQSDLFFFVYRIENWLLNVVIETHCRVSFL